MTLDELRKNIELRAARYLTGNARDELHDSLGYDPSYHFPTIIAIDDDHHTLTLILNLNEDDFRTAMHHLNELTR